MTKEEIAKGTGFLSASQIDLLMVTYYMSQLKELGLIEGGPSITAKGVDLASDFLNLGWKLTREEIIEAFEGTDMMEDPAMAAELIVELQDKG